MVSSSSDIHAAIRELTSDNLRYMKTFQIEDKNRRILPFSPQKIQRSILRAIHPVGCRNVILKPSQVGASTAIIGYYLADTLTHPGTTSVVVAYEEFITQRLLNKAQFMYDQLSENLRPEMSHRSSHEKFFPGINSVFYIGSARAYTFGRGEVIHNFLADEYAFWPDTIRIMGPTLQRVPPNGRVNVLSTPNGEDNDFARLYKAGLEENSQWRSHFFPWHWHEEYFYPSGSPYALPKDRTSIESLEPQEEKLIELGVTEDQLRWYRAKRAELRELNRAGDSELLMEQEFPNDDVSCFLAAGNMIYDYDLIADLAQRAPTFPVIKRESHFDIWFEPEDGVEYVVSCDPGMGRQTKTVIAVTQWWEEDGKEYGRLCAALVGLVETAETVELCKMIARKYNTAEIVSEANGHGVAVINGLRDYPRVYRRVEILKGKKTTTPGWLTTTRTKPYMIKRLKEVLDYMEIPSQVFVSQLRNLRWGKNTKGDTIIESVGEDDAHDALAIAAACRTTGAPTKGFKGQSGWGRNPSW